MKKEIIEPYKTPDDRKHVYQEMLDLYKSNKNKDNLILSICYGFCYALTSITGMHPYYVIKQFPELMLYKPKHNYYDGSINTGFWWSKHSPKKRIQVLEEIISKM